MKNKPYIVALVGSYRKNGVVSSAVEEILASAGDSGAETKNVFLPDTHIEFCTNCRSCTQEEGSKRGKCVLDDSMGELLDMIERSDAVVLASPMNVGTVTAITKRFIERLIGFYFWPWGTASPKIRNPEKNKKAVLVTSSAAPAIFAGLSGTVQKQLKTAAGLLGATPAGVLSIGLAAQQIDQELDERSRKKARMLGKQLVEAVR